MHETWEYVVQQWHALYDETISVTVLLWILLFVLAWNGVHYMLKPTLNEGQLRMARKRTVLRQGSEHICDFVEELRLRNVWDDHDCAYFYRTVTQLGLPDLKPRKKPYPPYLKKQIKERLGKQKPVLVSLDRRENNIPAPKPKMNGSISDLRIKQH